MSQNINIPGLGELPNPEAIYESWWPIIIGLVCGLIYGIRQYMRGSRCMDNPKMDGKVVIITGGAGDIAHHTALDLLNAGAKVYLACRTSDEAKKSEEELKKISKKKEVFGLKCDLASFKSIKEFASNFKKKEEKLNMLIMNGGVMMCPFSLTEDKFERQFQVNYLGHFLLTHLLLELIRKSEGGRIVGLMAPAYQLGDINYQQLENEEEATYKTNEAYARSKLALFMFCQKLAKMLKDVGIPVNCVLPGIANTKIYRHLPFQSNSFLSFSLTPVCWFLMKTAEDGAQTVLFCVKSEKAGTLTGMMFKECAETGVYVHALDEGKNEELFRKSLLWIGAKTFGVVENNNALSE